MLTLLKKQCTSLWNVAEFEESIKRGRKLWAIVRAGASCDGGRVQSADERIALAGSVPLWLSWIYMACQVPSAWQPNPSLASSTPGNTAPSPIGLDASLAMSPEDLQAILGVFQERPDAAAKCESLAIGRSHRARLMTLPRVVRTTHWRRNNQAHLSTGPRQSSTRLSSANKRHRPIAPDWAPAYRRRQADRQVVSGP